MKFHRHKLKEMRNGMTDNKSLLCCKQMELVYVVFDSINQSVMSNTRLNVHNSYKQNYGSVLFLIPFSERNGYTAVICWTKM